MSVSDKKDQPVWTGDAQDERGRKLHELQVLRRRVEELERELAVVPKDTAWQREFYPAYYATTGFLLGFFGAAVSLLFNIVGSVMFPGLQGEQAHPLRLIQVYLTFPLGEQALTMNSGLALAIGCCLYLGTGMLYGMIFNVVLHRWAPQASLPQRFVVATVLSLAIWLVNFYGILSWLQPLLFGGKWILTEVPVWVAALTHLVFGWTMVLLYPWGRYEPYRLNTEEK